MSSAPFKEGQRVKLSGADGIDKAKGLKDGDIGTVSADGHNIVEVVWDSLKPERAIMADHQIEVLEEELPPDFGYRMQLPESLTCSCSVRNVVNFGCGCEAGKAELAKERGR